MINYSVGGSINLSYRDIEHDILHKWSVRGSRRRWHPNSSHNSNNNLPMTSSVTTKPHFALLRPIVIHVMMMTDYHYLLWMGMIMVATFNNTLTHLPSLVSPGPIYPRSTLLTLEQQQQQTPLLLHLPATPSPCHRTKHTNITIDRIVHSTIGNKPLPLTLTTIHGQPKFPRLYGEDPQRTREVNIPVRNYTTRHADDWCSLEKNIRI